MQNLKKILPCAESKLEQGRLPMGRLHRLPVGDVATCVPTRRGTFQFQVLSFKKVTKTIYKSIRRNNKNLKMNLRGAL